MLFPRPWLLIVAACLCWVSDAAANGRFPRSQRLIRNPVDAQHLVLAGTFGLAVTRNGGATWSHICESAFTEPNTILDPLVGFSKKTGTLYTGTLVDLRRSDAAVCEFDKVLGDAETSVPDYTFDVDGETLVALTSKSVAGKSQTTLQTSKDGEAWAALGTPIADRGVLTLDVAPSDDQRLYVTALAPTLDAEGTEVGQRGVLLVSEDRGNTWEELTIPGTSLDSQPFIAAVHPENADTLLVRLSSTTLNEMDLPLANDALLVSYDAGRTWTELLRKSARLLAFALSPDGTTVLAGFGAPDTAAEAVSAEFGLYRLALEPGIDSGLPEAQHILETIPIHCLSWMDKELFVCMKQFQAGFEVGVTEDHNFTEFSALKSVLLLNDIEGPSVCPSDSEAAACAGLWDSMSCKQLFACLNDAPGAIPSADSGPPSVDASAVPQGEGRAPPKPGVPPTDSEKKSGSNCGCRVGTATASPAFSVLGLWLALALVWRRGRKRAAGVRTRAI